MCYLALLSCEIFSRQPPFVNSLALVIFITRNRSEDELPRLNLEDAWEECFLKQIVLSGDDFEMQWKQKM